jgi:hypothetical protein
MAAVLGGVSFAAHKRARVALQARKAHADPARQSRP